MFKKKPDIKSFGARDIQRYIDGGMSPAERNELERAALGDPLLEKALEGYASLSPDNQAGVQEDLSAIRSRLAARVRQAGRKQVPLFGYRATGSGMRRGTWMRAAAVVVLLAGAGILLYVRFQADNTSRRGDLAERASTVQSSPGTPAVPPPAAISPNAAAVSPGKMTISPGAAPRMSPPAGRKRAASPDVRQGTPTDAVPQISPASLSPEGKTGDSTAGVAIALEGKVAGVFNRDTLFDKLRDRKVIGFNNQPVIGAIVRVLPSGPTTITDRNGYFNFGADPVAGDSTATVLIEAVGYTSRQYPVNQLDQLQTIQLKENTNSLNDVVVIGYGVPKNKTEARKMSATYHAIDDSSEAQPINGWSAFNLYISHNMAVPGEVLNKDIHGDVILSFDVNREGNPIGILVDKSLCIPCDTEAIRLLKEGPQWNKGKKKRAKGRVKVHF